MSHNVRGNPTTQTVAATVQAAGTPAGTPVPVHGSAHWPRDPTPAERCALTGRPDWPDVLARLAILLDRPYRWPDPIPWSPERPQGDPDDNLAIPAGYTYLLQFVGHDMVNTSPPVWAADPAAGSANLRHRRLMLDTLYGDGPGSEPGAYATSQPGGGDRTRLRLGTLAGIAPGACPMRDLFRVASPGAGAPPALNAAGCFDVLAADPRNDDNAVLSQLTVLFASLHNGLAGAVAAQPGVQALPEPVRTERIFATARSAMAGLFRRVVREDLLPRLLHPHVRSHHGPGAKPIWHGEQLPLEFSHGAMRAGHAMVRDHYFFDAGSESDVALADGISAGAPARLPRGRRWAARWSRFFAFKDALSPNASRRIGPGMSSSLLITGLFPAIDGTDGRGLPHRDLMSATRVGLWSAPALIAAIAAARPGLIPPAWLFAPGNPAGPASVAAYLKSADAAHNAGLPHDLTLADLPLPFFMLLEAALDPQVNGRHLGLLGSIIVADVLYRALADAEAADPPATGLLPAPLAAQLAAVADMPGLVRLVDGLAFGPAADPPLV